jgi:hypothetical protein
MTKNDFQNPITLPTGWTCGDDLTLPLLAGKWTTVGSVVVTSDDDNIYVKYLINDDTKWAISETHLSITTTADKNGVPNTVPGYPGNPKIGLFNFNTTHANVSEYLYTIPLTEFNRAKDLYILAHAVVKDPTNITGWVQEPILLPEIVDMTLSYPNSDSYFGITISNDGVLNGFHDGWCLDLDKEITPTSYKAYVVSSLVSGFNELNLVEKPENMFKVNWLLNQDIVGTVSTDGLVFTLQDFQMALWWLVEDVVVDPGIGNWTQAHVDEILGLTNHLTSFIPTCEFPAYAVILRPLDANGLPTVQTGIIKQYIKCTPVYGGDETAWAAGKAFPGDSWAMFFEYCVN